MPANLPSLRAASTRAYADAFRRLILVPLVALGVLSILASGGGGGGSGSSAGSGSGSGGGSAPSTPTLNVGFGLKQLQFSWAAVTDADIYRLFENPDGVSGYTQVGADLPAGTTSTTIDIAVHFHDWANARYLLEACNTGGCTDSNEVTTTPGMFQAIGSIAAGGSVVALSADGNTLAARSVGGVYVFTRSGITWSQQADVSDSNTETGDSFGNSLALSADGNTLAVGAYLEDSAAIGINGDQTDNSAVDAGAVYVYTRSGTTWSQQAYIKASNTEGDDRFGTSLALSGDGNTLTVATEREDSAATGINGNQADNSATDAGAVYVYTRSGTTWSQQAYVKASNTDPGDAFGISVALSGNGNTLAVGAKGEDSDNGNENDNSGNDDGAVYVFTRSGGSWSQQAYVKGTLGPGIHFGESVAMSADGSTLAVGAPYQTVTIVQDGAVHIFIRLGSTWGYQGFLPGGTLLSGDLFGAFLTLSADGNTLAVGATGDDGAFSGVALFGPRCGGNSSAGSNSGAICVFTRSGSSWSARAYVKAPNYQASAGFGRSFALSGDGKTLAAKLPGAVALY